MADEIPTIPARLDGLEWKVICPRCSEIVVPTPFDQLYLCVKCNQLYAVEFPDPDILSFETLVYYEIMKDLTKDPSDIHEEERKKQILELLIRLGARIKKVN